MNHLTPTTPADHVEAARAGSLGIGAPPVPAYAARFVQAERELRAIEKRTGETLELAQDEELRGREWSVIYADGTVIAQASDPLVAVGAAGSIL